MMRLSRRLSMRISRARWRAFALLIAAIGAQTRAQTAVVRVTGVVRDSSGAAIRGAKVELRAQSYSATAITSSAGDFTFENVPATSGTIVASANGFQQVEQKWNAAAGGAVQVDIVISLLAVSQRVVVTARTPTALSDSPTSEREIASADLDASPNLTLDDTLRQIPGFSLFRRSGSRTANPTTQGVSLRGLGANGASRALVLEDGIPMNDPFGAWVYWDRIPEVSVDNIQISQEGGSSLYGSDALGGVIEFFTRSPEQKGITLETSDGNQNTPDLSLWAGGTEGRWEASFGGEVFRTDGYVLTPEADRGSVDTRAGSDHGTADLRVGRKIGNNSDIFARGWFLSESRANGTLDQVNDTRLGQGALGADLQLGSLGSLTLRFYGDAQTYHQTFSSIAADRNSETLTDIQTVPAQGVGGSGVWSRALGHRKTLVAGFDLQEAIGRSDEILPVASKETSAGGRQRSVGIFGEDLIQITPRWTLAASAHFDDWRNFDASLISALIASPGAQTVTAYADRSYQAFSPRLSVVNQVSAHVSWSVSIYRAFRAPTLNELYRSFRVGNTLTQSNANLSAEHLTGGEAGIAVETLDRRLQIRGTAFLNEIIDPVANVTLSATSVLITRQRQNLGRTRAPGVEIDGTAQIMNHLQFAAGYQYVDATVTQFPADTTLVGLRVAQVPHHVVTFQARYENASRINFSVDGRMVGQQFDDDLNHFPMGRFFVLDAMAWRGIGRGVGLFFAGENLFNTKYSTAATPVPQLGLPIAVRAGLRFDLPQQ